jgi:hypothetical protein
MAILENVERPGIAVVAFVLFIYALAAGSAAR